MKKPYIKPEIKVLQAESTTLMTASHESNLHWNATGQTDDKDIDVIEGEDGKVDWDNLG